MEFIKENVVPTILLILSLILAGIYIYIGSIRTLTSFEGVLFQFLILASGLLSSYIFGKQSAKEAAKEIIKPHARSAFRRLISLYGGLSRIANLIADTPECKSEKENELLIAKIKEIVISQISTADDALKDWEDVVPEEVEELKEDFFKKNSHIQLHEINEE